MFARILIVFTAFSSIIIGVYSVVEPFVVGGSLAAIEDYPHSAFLAIKSNNENWICGSSIINHKILLTAAHCLEDCPTSSRINIVVGNERRDQGFQTVASYFIVHHNYDAKTITNDIALIKVKTPLPLGPKVKRIVLIKTYLLNEIAKVAGWGTVNEDTGDRTMWLKHTRQKLWSRRNCKQVLTRIPNGVICGGESNADSDFAAAGDSGSALVVRGYIQVGIVSNKIPQLSRSLVVYTDVVYFYNWIIKNTKKLSCYSRSKKKLCLE